MDKCGSSKFVPLSEFIAEVGGSFETGCWRMIKSCGNMTLSLSLSIIKDPTEHSESFAKLNELCKISISLKSKYACIVQMGSSEYR